MIGLLRYMFVKGWRDRSLVAVLMGPAVLIGSPIIGIGVSEAIRGNGGFPFVIFRGSAGPQITAVTLAAAGASILAAATAAFLSLRNEVVNRSLGSFVLARRPMEVAAAATATGTALGLGSFAVSLSAIALLMGGASGHVAAIAAMTIAGSIVSAAAGVLLLSISSATGMMLPLSAIAVVASVYLLDSFVLSRSMIVAAAALVMILTASLLLEQRCGH